MAIYYILLHNITYNSYLTDYRVDVADSEGANLAGLVPEGVLQGQHWALFQHPLLLLQHVDQTVDYLEKHEVLRRWV